MNTKTHHTVKLTIGGDNRGAPTDPHRTMHQHALAILQLLFNHIASLAEYREKVFSRYVLLVLPHMDDTISFICPAHGICEILTSDR